MCCWAEEKNSVISASVSSYREVVCVNLCVSVCALVAGHLRSDHLNVVNMEREK